MPHSSCSFILPVLMAAVRQREEEGVLALEQGGLTRRLFWKGGRLVRLESQAPGEQLDALLLNQGILDRPTLESLVAAGGGPLERRVVQEGVVSPRELDWLLLSLQEQRMIRALEAPLARADWLPGSGGESGPAPALDHRIFLWNTFWQARNRVQVSDALFAERHWRWAGEGNLVERLADLPLTPGTAYALSFFGPEPLGFETFLSLSPLPEEEGALLIMTLWALGALTLVQGTLPALGPAPESRALEPKGIPEEAPNGEPPSAASRPEQAPAETPAPQLRARRLVAKGKSLALQDKVVEAIRTLEQALQLEPDAPFSYEAWLILGRLRLANPAWTNRSIDAFRNATRLRPHAAEPWAAMGDVYHRKGFAAQARDCFRKARELDPEAEIPEDVDLEETEEAPLPAPTLLSRLKGLLG